MERNEFLKKCGALCLSGIALSTLLQGCKAAYYIPNTFMENKLAVNKSDFLEHTWVLVKSERFAEPIYLRKLQEDEYSAVLLHCMHKGCEVNPADDYLICPCHGSEYTATGKVVHGPAERDLLKFAVNTDQEKIYIQL